jgi:dihydrolipoamide dehydrogenase
MDTKHYDLIVFGGGNAISTAIQCGAKGLKVAAVEKGPLGGTCPHRGCIPSKLLIGYADAAENARDARRFGFETTVRTADPDAILRDTFDFTKNTTASSKRRSERTSRSIATAILQRRSLS